ncbi:MAG: hypothetical protein H0U34_04725 [Sphingomonas sp.]|nr:hypothetical protein [Sphingomonas sp.]
MREQAGLQDAGEPRAWWETRTFVALLMLLSTIPLLYPANPPLVDLLGHIGRYRVQLDLDTSLLLQRYYDYDWAPIGNLGVDLLVQLLGPILGLELAVKLIVLSIPPMTVAGFLWVAREVHHRLPPMSLFALLFVYNHPFHFGFVNFALAMALAFLAFGLWLRLGRLDRLKLRAILFVPISFVLFFTHAFGWGTLGLLAFSAEAVRQHDSGRGWFRSGLNAALHASVMALPLLVMLAWRADTQGDLTRNWFEWKLKWEWIYSAVRDRWRWFDIATVAVIPLVFLFALFNRRLTLSRNLVFSAIVLVACFVLLPWTMFGSAYADMRLAPYMIALVPLAMRFRSETHLPTARAIAVVGLALLLVRLGGTTASLGMAGSGQQARLEALDHVPRGARVASLVGRDCRRVWELPRNSHLPGMVIARREGLSNDQWAIDGTNLLTVRYPPAGIFQRDPSQMVFPNFCGQLPWARWTIDTALKAIPRDAIDYVWLVDAPPHDPELTSDMTLVWQGPGSMLYRVREP